MKKLLAVILVFTLVLSMGAFAFATEGYEDGSPVKVRKKITLGNAGTVKPAETFSFTVGDGSYSGPVADTTAPAFDPNTFSIDVEANAADGTAEIILPEFEHVGEYLYPITEDDVSTAGFVKDDATYYLKITVINNEDYNPDDEDSERFIRVLTLYDGKDVKTDAFDNKFNAGSLVVKKAITGNNAVFDDEFEVTVVLTPDEGKYIKEGPISIEGASSGLGSVAKNEDGTVTIKFMVSHESEVTIANIPYNVTYAVTEAAGDYTATIENATGQINSSTKNVNITNDRDRTIETGVNLDNLPYILILGAVTIGLFGFTMKRRFNK